MKMILPMILLWSASVFAGVSAYSGTAGDQVLIESAPQLGANAFLVKVSGISSKWADKVIQTERQTAAGQYRYSFRYAEELSDGKHEKTYQLVVEAGQALKNGSEVKRIELFYPTMANHKPVLLTYDEALTKTSQKVNLAADYKKAPFHPDPNED